MKEQDLHVWKTFMAVTLLSSATLSLAASWIGVSTPTLATNTLGAALTVGDLIEMLLAAVIGGVATVMLNRHKHNGR